MKVSQIMTRRTITIGMDHGVRNAIKIFKESGFHHLLVVKKRKLVAVVSDRDLLRTLSPFIGTLSDRPQDLATLNRRIHQIMAHKLGTVTSDKRVEEAADIMLDHGVSCLPVVAADGHPVGILTWRDIVRALCGLTG